MPFRATGTVDELDETLQLFQRHFSVRALRESFVEPSGLQEVHRAYYGERLLFYELSRCLPGPIDWSRRPWNTLLTRLLLREVSDAAAADAVFLALRKPGS